MLARKISHSRFKFTMHTNRTHKSLDTCGFKYSIVILTKGRGLVNNAGACIDRNVVICNDNKGTALNFLGKIIKQGFIRTPLQGRPFDDLKHLKAIFIVSGQSCLGEIK